MPDSTPGSAAEVEREMERSSRSPREPSPTRSQLGRNRLETIRVMYEDEMSNADALLPTELRSLRGRVHKYATRRELTISDIVDCGRATGTDEPRYAVKYDLTKPVFDTVSKMQLVLTSLTAYLPERTHTYQIDPKDAFSRILLHAASLQELQLAWVGLTGRLMGAERVYEKYFAEALRANGVNDAELHSQPTTTPSTVYRKIEEEEDPHRRLRLALGGLPNARAATDGPRSGRAVEQFLDADVREMTRVPTPIARAFPPREAEPNPALVYYDELDRRREIPPRTTYENPLGYSPVDSPRGRTESWRRGVDQTAPPQPPPLPPRPPAPPPPAPPVDKGGQSPHSSSSSSTTSHESSDSSSSSSSSTTRRRRRRRARKEEEGAIPPGDETNPVNASKAPIPGINPVIKPESLPSWDGNRNTAMVYFWNIVELARQGGRMPQALARKDYMREGHSNYISSIRRHYLGPAWMSALSSDFRMQHFRDPKNPRESPQDFIHRRIMYCRSLGYATEDSRHEAKLIMDVAPKGWKLMLNFTSVKSTDELQARVIEHSEDLVLAYTRDKRLETAAERPPSRPSWRASAGAAKDVAHAYDVETMEEESEELPVSGEGAEPEGLQRDLFAVAYAVAAKRAAANTSYSFPARDDVLSKGKKPPPGPCFACGSLKHWNKDCPHWNEFEKRRRETGLLVESAADLAYDTAYVLAVEQGFDRASRTLAGGEQGRSKTQEETEGGDIGEREEVLLMGVSPFVSKIEEIADDYWHRGECLPVESVYYLESIWEGDGDAEGLEGRGVKEEINLACAEEPPPLDEALAALKPYDPGKIRLVPRRGALRLPDGNTSVLSVRGRVGSSRDVEVDLRIDSGASVTLVSLGHYHKLISPPPIRTEEGSRLMQLTKRDAPVKGKVRLSFQIFCNDGTTLEMDCEVQIVEGMTVPVLLGEDFQQAYELSVRRALELDGTSSTTIEFGGAPEHPISATPVRRSPDYDRVAKSFLGEMPAEKIARGSFVSRAKQKLRERKRKAEILDSLILAAKDTRLPPNTCVKVEVLGPFESPGEWVVEKILLSSDDDRFLAVPNTIISSAAPFVPLANPSDSPRMIRKGEVLGRVIPAQEYFDKPGSQEKLDKMKRHADLMEGLCRARMASPENQKKTKARAPDKAWRMPHPQNYGAWAAALGPNRLRSHRTELRRRQRTSTAQRQPLYPSQNLSPASNSERFST
ncbi:uncharacterized protein SCHCODRAFT_02686158 [Schizophyllum commune H4-8]|uniref:CCHC-type domain-containing protein n=1 Tax=Schizophyllum commune (strain H4-8 / FGSC 9210) TaxID=578458 RepID=D8Q2Q2_SCHCM|nr:uncharacterized protein SCHCODRAFT_02686158 [Schizophyllum commune H4-8]KAI5894554.1 hypothetical protein SCHCODRAFT_02686158 [Schizophyllum commune H4-8]